MLVARLGSRDKMRMMVSIWIGLKIEGTNADCEADLQGIAYEHGTAGRVDMGSLVTFDTLAFGTPAAGKFAASTFNVDCYPPGTFPRGTC